MGWMIQGWQARTRAYGIVMLEPWLLRASIGVLPVTEDWSDPPVLAAAIPPFTPGTVPGVKEPPRKGSLLDPKLTGVDILALRKRLVPVGIV